MAPRKLSARPGGIVWRLALRSLAANRVRTAVSACGIVLACALATAVLVTITSLSQSLGQRVAETEGGWYVWSGAASQAAADALLSDERVDGVAISCELGCALLDSQAAEVLGFPSLAVIEMPSYPKGARTSAPELTRLPELAEGRLPEAPDEILLPIRLKGLTLGAQENLKGTSRDAADPAGVLDGEPGATSDGPLYVGSQLTLELGTRVFADGMHGYATDERQVPVDEKGQPLPQHLENCERLTYTVVGFRRPQEDVLATNLIASRSSGVALTCAGGASALAGVPTARQVWASTPGYTGFDAFDAAMGAAFALPDASPTARVSQGEPSYHWSLIRYRGMVANRKIFDGLNGAAAVLVAVIVLAGVSLVYTSFAISVGERMQQMGLMASLGASARQLRQLVLSEAVLLGGACIPVGIACGLAGVAATLHVTSDSFAYLLKASRGLELHAPGPLLAGIAAASAVVVLVSAGVPALRAGRVPAIEAIRRRREVRLGLRGRREVARMRRQGLLPTSRGRLGTRLARVAGVPGFVAHRNLVRTSTRGWVVALSLGVSFALVVTAGVVGAWLHPWEELASARGADAQADVTVSLYGVGHGTAVSIDDYLAVAGTVRDALAELPDATVTGVEHQAQLHVRIPSALVHDSLRAVMDVEDAQMRVEGDDLDLLATNGAHMTSEGDFVGTASVDVVDEALWGRMCQQVGVDPAGQDVALALDRYETTWLPSSVEVPEGVLVSARVAAGDDDSLRLSGRAFATTGEVEALELDDDALVFDLPEEMGLSWVLGTHGGEPGVRLTYDVGDEWAGERWVPLAEALDDRWTLRVVGLTRRLTDAMGRYGASGSYPMLIVPERVALAHPPLMPYGTDIGVSSDDPGLERRVRDAMSGVPGDFDYYVQATEGNVRQLRALAFALRLFVVLFAVVATLIAVANAAGTLSSSVRLRAHEFAVLRSVGMGPSAFGRMIACECASYALRGLAVGAVLAAAIHLAFGAALQGAVFDAAPQLPWAAVTLGAAGVVGCTALTTGLALRASGATTIVDALRSDVG